MMNTQEVAGKLVQLYREGKSLEAINDLYDEEVVSHEVRGLNIELVNGKAAVIANTRNWIGLAEVIHSSVVSEPQVTGDFFSCTMEFDVTYKGLGRRMMNEICVYQVRHGKVIAEWFHYDPKQVR